MLYAKKEMEPVHVHACLSILETLTVFANQSVRLILTATGRKHVSTKNVQTRVLEFVEIMQNVMLSTIRQVVCALLVLLEIHQSVAENLQEVNSNETNLKSCSYNLHILPPFRRISSTC